MCRAADAGLQSVILQLHSVLYSMIGEADNMDNEVVLMFWLIDVYIQ